MNFILGALGANLTLGLISGVTGAANGVYTLSTTILQSTASGADDVKQIIHETDLEVKIKTTQLLLCELKINDKSPNTIRYCVQAIRDAIKEIADELDKIHFRMQYNNNLLIGSSLRSYKFHNCRARLNAKLKNLESRNQSLISVMAIQPAMYRNTTLSQELGALDDSLLQIDQVDPKAAEMVRADLHKKLEFMRK